MVAGRVGDLRMIVHVSKLKLSRDELFRRARSISLVVTDCDGVLTDTGVYYSETGEIMKRFSIRDGMGVERLRNEGIETAILTGEKSLSVQRRAEKLKLKHFWLGVQNKGEFLNTIIQDTHTPVEQMAYIGDDYNDLQLLEAVGQYGLTGAPADAMPAVRTMVHRRCAAKCGYGAFRDFAEWILSLRAACDKHDKTMDRRVRLKVKREG